MTTTTLTREWVDRLQDKANQALLDHDWPTLEHLVAPGARIVGPRGFLISRDRWIGVHQESTYEQERIEVVESVVDSYDNCAVRIDLVESRCRYEGQTIAGRFRVCQTWVTVEGTPQLAAVQYTSSDGGADR
jgi:hypothetical protein